jgi:hypothetical protein
MQEKKFEEEVRRKMTELSFTPSEPVWARVENEIRNKRKGRRILLWLFPLMLVTGLTYYLINEAPEPASMKNAAVTASSNASTHNLKSLNKSNPDSISTNEPNHRVQRRSVATPLSQPKGEVSHDIVFMPDYSHIKKNTGHHLNVNTYRTSNSNRNKNSITETNAEIKGEKVVGIINNRAETGDNEKPGEVTQPANSEDSKTSDPVARNATENVDSSRKIAGATDSVRTPAADTAIAIINDVANPKKHSKKRWSVSINTSVGITGVSTKALPFVNGSKSNVYQSAARDNMFASATAAPGAAMANLRSVVVPDAPSKVRRNLGFSAGIGLNKKISSRIGFSTGLQFARFSTLTSIGRKVQSASASANDFYLNTRLVEKDYETRYDILEVPVSLDWQVLRAKPLRFHAGIGIGYLVATNALQYDPAMNIYYVDKSMYRTTQFSAWTGFDYTIMKKGNYSLSLGPKMGFGLSNLLRRKTYGQQHLYFAGIGSSFSF